MPLTNSQYDSIMYAYSERRMANARLQEARREEAYTRIPELADIERSVSEASLAAARRRIAGDYTEEDRERLHQYIEEQHRHRIRLLEEHGFPADYLEPVYSCPICRDTGFADGKPCACFKQESTKLLSRESHLEKILEKENFDHFSLAYYPKSHIDPLTGKSSYELMTENLDQANIFIDTFGRDFRNLFLYGHTGLGKTFLSHCIAKELLDQNYFVVYFSAVDFFDMASDRHFARDDDADRLYRRALEADLVILDDLGTEVPNSFSISALFAFLNSRIDAGRPTIISTNLTLDQFKDIYGDRIFSRVMSFYKFLPFVGDDIREQTRTASS